MRIEYFFCDAEAGTIEFYLSKREIGVTPLLLPRINLIFYVIISSLFVCQRVCVVISVHFICCSSFYLCYPLYSPCPFISCRVCQYCPAYIIKARFLQTSLIIFLFIFTCFVIVVYFVSSAYKQFSISILF